MALDVDVVRLTLAGDEIQIVQGYDVRSAILTQPAGFSLRLGHGGVAAELLARYPENTPFELRVNDQLVQTGFTDAVRTQGGATEVTFDGRDLLGKLVSAYAPADQTFSNLTYRELTERVLGKVGYDIGGDYLLLSDDTANRKAISGTVITQLTAAEIEITERQNAGAEVTDKVEGTRKTSYRSATLKVGKRWYEFLKTQLDRAGLFLWATGDGNFVLSVPTGAQTPAYQISRGGTDTDDRVLGRVVDHQHSKNTTDRYTKMIVHGRGGGRVHGRAKFDGEFVDQEMAALFGGANAKIFPVHDNDVTSSAQAVHYARRRMAELNREGWQLSYTLSGHTTVNNRGHRALWTPNTVVTVDDRLLGIRGDYWIEAVSFKGSPQTATVRLMRPSDMFFSTELAAA